MTRGEYMRRARKTARLSQEALEKLSGVSKHVIGFIERGTTIGSIDVIELLADALGLSIDEYVGHNCVKEKRI